MVLVHCNNVVAVREAKIARCAASRPRVFLWADHCRSVDPRRAWDGLSRYGPVVAGRPSTTLVFQTAPYGIDADQP